MTAAGTGTQPGPNARARGAIAGAKNPRKRTSQNLRAPRRRRRCAYWCPPPPTERWFAEVRLLLGPTLVSTITILGRRQDRRTEKSQDSDAATHALAIDAPHPLLRMRRLASHEKPIAVGAAAPTTLHRDPPGRDEPVDAPLDGVAVDPGLGMEPPDAGEALAGSVGVSAQA
jgi:hypothetical protein